MILATKVSLHQDGSRAAADLLDQATNFSPQRPVTIRKAYQKTLFPDPKTPRMMPVENALSLIVKCDLSRTNYEVLRENGKKHNSNIYPPYTDVSRAKDECYPLGIIIDDSSACIPLDELLNHTLKRLLTVIEMPTSTTEIELHCKWGADGSSGYNEFQQKPSTDSSSSDANLFLITVVPIRLVDSKNGTIIWNNPRPSSTRFCRPLRFLYEKESKELVKEQIESVQSEIRNLAPTTVLTNDDTREITCKYHMYLTMVGTTIY